MCVFRCIEIADVVFFLQFNCVFLLTTKTIAKPSTKSVTNMCLTDDILQEFKHTFVPAMRMCEQKYIVYFSMALYI
jgi:hypothetical protein